MEGIPVKLKEFLSSIVLFEDPNERVQILIDYADKFSEVPPDIATRPFGEVHKVPACESDAYVWAIEQANHTLKFYFAVENPSGVSAKALAVILDKTLSGQDLNEVINVSTDIVQDIFRQNISMGKGLGLMSMVEAVKTLAKRHLSVQAE
jgi:cysteine desulfuration protein SufE